jgi:cyclohexyl-isocyanide hydratase
MEDEVQLAWLRERASQAALVTSVCTGSLILAAAGLLRGYKATSYWAMRDKLSLFGAEPVAQRVVVDRNRITGGGVTAGIDFAFRVVEHLHGRDTAEEIRLALEYDPEPLGAGGTPETAMPEILAKVRERMLAGGGAERAAAVARIANK